VKGNYDRAHRKLETPQKLGLLAVGMEVKDINTTVKKLKSKGTKITCGPHQ
jgi:hypothetical protein